MVFIDPEVIGFDTLCVQFVGHLVFRFRGVPTEVINDVVLFSQFGSVIGDVSLEYRILPADLFETQLLAVQKPSHGGAIRVEDNPLAGYEGSKLVQRPFGCR